MANCFFVNANVTEKDVQSEVLQVASENIVLDADYQSEQSKNLFSQPVRNLELHNIEADIEARNTVNVKAVPTTYSAEI